MSYKSVIIRIIFLFILTTIPCMAYAGYYEEGCKYYSAKKYEKAREMFLKSTEAGNDGNSYYFLGTMEKNEGNFDKAVEYYKLAVSGNIHAKYKKMAYWDMIVIIEQKGNYSEMAVLCRELWERMGDESAKKSIETLINKFLWTDNDEAKAIYNDGLEYKKKDQTEKAKESFLNAIREDSKFLAPRFEIGLIYYNDNNINQAISYFNDIIDKVPFYGEVHLLLGEMYYNKQSFTKSIEHYNEAILYSFIDAKTKYSIHLKTGSSYYETGDYDNAIKEFTTASDLNRKEIEPFLMISAINIKKGNLEQALPPLLKARDLNPNNSEIIFQIGTLYYKTDDQKYAQYFNSLFSKYHKTTDQVPQKYLKAFILLFKNNYENKKYEDALKVMEMIPDSMKTAETNLMTARACFNAGKHEKAIEYFEKMSLENDDKFLLSISYAKAGLISKSRDILLYLADKAGYLEKAKAESAIRKTAQEIEAEIKNNEKAAEEEKLKEEAANTQKQESIRDESSKTQEESPGVSIEKSAEVQ